MCRTGQSDGTNLHIWDCMGDTNQQWTLTDNNHRAVQQALTGRRAHSRTGPAN